jgi:hypothetical protein
MNNPSFVYCFSKKLAVNEEHYVIILELLSEAIGLLKRFFSYRIVTDEVTYEDLKNLSTNIQIVNSDNFVLFDDFKIKLIKNLKVNEVLIDPDILMKMKPKYDLNADLIFDYKEVKENLLKWYGEIIEETKGTLIYDRIKTAPDLTFIPNIGILKINHPKLLLDYTETYTLYRKDLLSKIKTNQFKYSVLLGQYLLGILLYEGNYSYFDLRSVNTGRVYVHLAGQQKYIKLKQKSII